MLRITQSTSAKGAKHYYSRADYLSESQELTGQWYGKAAQLLGLSGEVEKSEFDRMCDNQHPFTKEQLTLRQSKGRTVGYDFNFHVPKGVSVAYEVLEDDRILDAFNDAVDATMHEIEKEAATRVRKHYSDTDRNVGNLAWAKYVHKTTRPVDGIPDPHLHAHCFCFNSVFDAKENDWKAGQFRSIKRDAPYFEAAFHARLAENMKSLGYEVERRGKYWDIGEVPEAVAGKFSSRKDLIEDLKKQKRQSLEEQAGEQGMTLAELATERGVTEQGLIRQKAILDATEDWELGALSRKAKESNLTMPELQEIWRARLSSDESKQMAIPTPRLTLAERNHEAAAYAIKHVFERDSVVPKRKLIAEALRFGVGDVTVAGVDKELEKLGVVSRSLSNREMATTEKVIAEERSMLEFIKHGKNSADVFVDSYKPKRKWLNKDQKNAAKQIVSSHDRVMLMRGGAGTGKTTLMTEATEAIEKAGTKVFAFAPSAEASRGVLTSEGFEATTVAELLVNDKLQGEVSGSLLWIDEAGLLSSGDLKRVMDVAKRQQCRVLLSGDPKQHKSVGRGDVLSLLEDEKVVAPILVGEIQRQKGDYRNAVEYLAKGQTEYGIEELSKLDWIEEIADEKERLSKVASDYADQFAKKKSTLVVSPTRQEAKEATDAIRSELKKRKLIGQTSNSVRQLIPRFLTEAEKSDSHNYSKNDVLVFHQNLPGIKRGSTLKANPEVLKKALQQPDRFSVYRESQIEFAKGDLIRVTKSGKSLNGKHRVYNGNVFKLRRIDRDGNLVLDNGWKLDKNFGHVTTGYVSTSHSSQGKTVDNIFLLESQSSYPAASKEQLYVSVSRGRKSARIYTDNIEDLKNAVNRSDQRITATELLKRRKRIDSQRRQTLVQSISSEHKQQQMKGRNREISR
ncbi:MAG: MobF family relaxase [Planctomycetota bacterium]